MGGDRTSDIIDEYRHPRDIADRLLISLKVLAYQILM